MIRIVLLGSLILTANVLASCDGKPTSTSAPPPAVTVSHPLQKSGSRRVRAAQRTRRYDAR